MISATNERLPVGLLPFLAEHFERRHRWHPNVRGQAGCGWTLRTICLHGGRKVMGLNHQGHWQDGEEQSWGKTNKGLLSKMVYLDVFHEQEVLETKQRLATHGTPNFGNSKYVPEFPDLILLFFSEQRDQGERCKIHQRDCWRSGLRQPTNDTHFQNQRPPEDHRVQPGNTKQHGILCQHVQGLLQVTPQLSCRELFRVGNCIFG